MGLDWATRARSRRGWKPCLHGLDFCPKMQWRSQSQVVFGGKNSSHLPKFPFQFFIALGCLTRVRELCHIYCSGRLHSRVKTKKESETQSVCGFGQLQIWVAGRTSLQGRRSPPRRCAPWNADLESWACERASQATWALQSALHCSIPDSAPTDPAAGPGIRPRSPEPHPGAFDLRARPRWRMRTPSVRTPVGPNIAVGPPRPPSPARPSRG